jgi:hypothetical protein
MTSRAPLEWNILIERELTTEAQRTQRRKDMETRRKTNGETASQTVS